jgi:hypothetical protein
MRGNIISGIGGAVAGAGLAIAATSGGGGVDFQSQALAACLNPAATIQRSVQGAAFRYTGRVVEKAPDGSDVVRVVYLAWSGDAQNPRGVFTLQVVDSMGDQSHTFIPGDELAQCMATKSVEVDTK